MKLSHAVLLGIFLLPFQIHAMDTPDDLIEEHVYDDRITYTPGTFKYFRDEGTLSVLPCLPQKAHNQNALIYDSPKEFKETRLYKDRTGQDRREQISNTATWPHCINVSLKMVVNGQPLPWGGSGTMVGPHHVLTCGHCVYDSEKEIWFDKIFAYPALNGESAPFGELKVAKAYIFKSWLKNDPNFDMALLLLDQSVGDYTGWGGLLSTSDKELFQEEVNITGYPGDKGFKYMWGMGGKIKAMTSEKIYYEHDTYGGQSGCAISINKYGMSWIAGVHTNGCGLKQEVVDVLPHNTDFYKSLTNSGVRLSEQKFTGLLLKVMPKTYVLDSTKARDAKIKLADMYYLGNGVDGNWHKALELYSELDKLYNDARAQYMCGEIYRLGIQDFPDPNKTKAIYYYEKSSSQGYRDATIELKRTKIKLADMYYSGNGVDGNWHKALELYSELDKLYDDARAQYMCGEIYRLGIQDFPDPNRTKAIHYYEKSSNQGYRDAKIKLADMYYSGDGVNKDWHKALELYGNLADDHNDERACRRISKIYFCASKKDFPDAGLKKSYEWFKKYLR